MTQILVADDHGDVRLLLALTLELEGYEVTTAADGGDAVAQARATRPSAIVLDVMMPRVDGLTALRALRESESTADIPVLLISGKAAAGDIEAGLQAGAAGYLVKPFEPDDVVAAVGRVTAGR